MPRSNRRRKNGKLKAKRIQIIYPNNIVEKVERTTPRVINVRRSDGNLEARTLTHKRAVRLNPDLFATLGNFKRLRTVVAIRNLSRYERRPEVLSSVRVYASVNKMKVIRHGAAKPKKVLRMLHQRTIDQMMQQSGEIQQVAA